MIEVVYATTSAHKRAEAHVLLAEVLLSDGTAVRDAFAIDFRAVRAVEDLEVSVERMVRSEVFKAYEQLKVPCFVEHAGLVWFGVDFPGGLTKPMWDTLGAESFLRETGAAGRDAVARACVAYCDGRSIEVFTGETTGRISDSPRGDTDDGFYWDSVFIPNEADGAPGDRTYAEITLGPGGLRQKVVEYSQSRKALVAFLDYRREHMPVLWPE